MVIDKGLRFHKHAQYLVDRATNAVNAIEVLASLSGVNLSILRRIFNATVRPILDYGSEVFCLMSTSSMNSLQTAQNTALKKCLGVANWTATDNVHRELNVLPVANRSEMTQAKLAHNIIQNSTHPLQQYIDSELHTTQRRRHRLWCPRFAGALRKLSTPPATTTPDVIATQVTLTPPKTTPRAKPPAPWTSIPVPYVVLNDHLSSKHTTEAELLKTLTLATLDQLTIDKPVFYTDGSVMESKAAAAAVHKGTSIQLRLNDGASILQAELVAIREAIYMATKANYNAACILSDSKAAIQAIDSLHPHDNKHLIKNIHKAGHFNVTKDHAPAPFLHAPFHVTAPHNPNPYWPDARPPKDTLVRKPTNIAPKQPTSLRRQDSQTDNTTTHKQLTSLCNQNSQTDNTTPEQRTLVINQISQTHDTSTPKQPTSFSNQSTKESSHQPKNQTQT